MGKIIENNRMVPGRTAAPSINASNFFEETEELMNNLYWRWQDECRYENINHYQIPLDSIAKKNNVIITQMNKRPFGCTFTTDDRTYQYKVTGTTISYKRIK